MKKSDVKAFEVHKTPFITGIFATVIKVKRERKHLITDLIQVSVIYKGGGGIVSHYYVTILSYLSEIFTCIRFLRPNFADDESLFLIVVLKKRSADQTHVSITISH